MRGPGGGAPGAFPFPGSGPAPTAPRRRRYHEDAGRPGRVRPPKEYPVSSPPLDDRDGAIWFNGTLTPWRDAKVHVLSHSLHYGNAVFEGARIYNGKVFKLREHSARLIHSARMLAYDLPYSVEELDAATNSGRCREQAGVGLRPPARVARPGGHRRLGHRDEGPRRHRGLPVGGVLRAEVDQARHEPVEAAEPGVLPGREQGRRAVHHLHAGQGRGPGRRRAGRPHARLQGPALRGHRGEPLPAPRRRAAHADARDASSTASPGRR